MGAPMAPLGRPGCFGAWVLVLKPRWAATFANGDPMPLLGLGSWKSTPGEVGTAVREAIRHGYCLIDWGRQWCGDTVIDVGKLHGNFPCIVLAIPSDLKSKGTLENVRP